MSQFLDTCDHLPLSRCLLSLGKPAPHWAVIRGYPKLSRLNNYRVRLLVGCDGLEADASRFRSHRFCQAPVGNSTCPLCHQDREDASHFIARCSALATERERLLRGRDELLRPIPANSVMSSWGLNGLRTAHSKNTSFVSCPVFVKLVHSYLPIILLISAPFWVTLQFVEVKKTKKKMLSL